MSRKVDLSNVRMSPPNCKIINFTPESCEWVRELLLEGSEGGNIWQISTKYYKARVVIDLLDHKEISGEETQDGQAGFEDTEAVIFHCDTSLVCLGKFLKTKLYRDIDFNFSLQKVSTECGRG